MISLQNNAAIISTTLSFFAFVFSITAAGTFQAYVARWMGDNTASRLGFADFNPLLHLGFLDLIFFALLDLMIGNPIPVNIEHVRSRRRNLRLGFIFESRALAHLICAIISQFFLVLIISSHGAMGVANIRAALPSHFYILSIFFGIMTTTNSILAAFTAIRDTMYWVVLYQLEKDSSFASYVNPLLFFGVIIFWIFLAQPIISTVLRVVFLVGSLGAAACGF